MGWKKFFKIIGGIAIWYTLYHYLQFITDFIVDDVFGMQKGMRLTETLRFFIFEVPKVMMLLILIVFFVGIIRTYFTPEKTRKTLEGKTLLTGSVMAALLGIVTPFCSCSAIPLFLGFVQAGVPLGVTFSFLISAPMINEVAVILLFGLFGWKVALLYVATGLVIAIISGYVIGKINLERYVESWVYEKMGSSVEEAVEKITFGLRMHMGYTAVKEIVGKVWVYIVIGIAVGAAAHGYVPESFMTNLMGRSEWYSVPLSVLIGVPLYSNAAGILPIVSVFIEKGVPLGTALAFMMAVIGLSLPEMIILKKVLKLPLILAFIGIVASGIMIVGFIFNTIF